MPARKQPKGGAGKTYRGRHRGAKFSRHLEERPQSAIDMPDNNDPEKDLEEDLEEEEVQSMRMRVSRISVFNIYYRYSSRDVGEFIASSCKLPMNSNTRILTIATHEDAAARSYLDLVSSRI